MAYHFKGQEESGTPANILKLVFIIVIIAICLFFGLYSLFWYNFD